MKNILIALVLLLLTNNGFSQKTALNFDGVDDYILIPGTTKLNGPTKISLETWVWTDYSSSPCADCAPIIWNQNTNSAYKLGTGNTQYFYVSLYNGAASVTLTTATAVSAKKWHHVAATFDGKKLKIYIDGAATDSATYSTFSISYGSTSSDIWIADPNTGFGGTLEETRIWDYARSQSQIKEGMARRYPSNQAGLLLNYGYEDGIAYANNTSISSIADKTNNANNGTAYKFAMQDSISNFVVGQSYCDTIAYSKFAITRCTKYLLPSKKKSVTVSGKYQDTIISFRGCDSVMTISVTILKATSSSFSLQGCDSVQNPTSKSYYKISGKYSITIPNAVGCDSVITHNVTIYKKDTTNFGYSGCNSVKLKNGNTVTVSGIYKYLFKSTKGCDSVVIHNVDIKKSSTAKVTLRMCRFIVCPTDKDVTYTKFGVYYDTIPNYANCDSIIEYTVISGATSAILSASSCNSYLSPTKKKTWTTSGTYYDTLFSSNYYGCDSTIKVNLIINSPSKQNLNITKCRMYTVPSGAKTVSTSGIITDVILSKKGCDSIQYTLNVTINNANVNISRTWNTLSAATTVNTATFQWLDCNNNYSAISGETGKSYTPLKDGLYALSVAENSCTDTSTCIFYVTSSVVELNNNSILISPNPTQGNFNISSSLLLHNVKITITNPLGAKLQEWNLSELKNNNFHAIVPSGLNFIKIESQEGFIIKYLVNE